MAGFTREVKRLFPLQSISSVLALFKSQLVGEKEPNLGLLSVVVGAIENQLTMIRSWKPIFPIIDLQSTEALLSKFVTLIKGSIDLSEFKKEKYATRELVKKVSDVVWGSLTRSFYKDRAHLQSLFSYLTGNKLDCFGVAFAVVAACQVLGFCDVHLALSEDHAWVVFGKDAKETAEVTWHGKGNEDKRGQSISVGVKDKSWLYLDGNPVICTRHMEVVAMVSGINPSISAATDSTELSSLQQDLLWMLYDMNHLSKYPMALGNLGDLEEISPTPRRQFAETLFREAIISSRTYYHDKHVYPYTYLGGFLYRCKQYKEALQTWANAADVIRNYNYTREDEEIYKEFLEIANELIPSVMRVCAESSSQQSIVSDPDCFSNLLRFYDGLCQWEEDSSTPVLHIGWTKPLVTTISKFDSKVRSIVDIEVLSLNDDENGIVDKIPESESLKNGKISNNNSDNSNKINEKEKPVVDKCLSNMHKNKKISFSNGSPNVDSVDETERPNKTLSSNENCENKNKLVSPDSNNNSKKRNTPDFINALASQIDNSETPHPNIAALAAHCGDNILNPDYLLSGQDPPFSSRFSSSSESSSSTLVDSKMDCREFLSTPSNGSPFPGMTMDSVLKAESPMELALANKKEQSSDKPNKSSVVLKSRKMMGLKELLLAEKLNGSAIQLHLTAQSQVQVSKRSRHSSEIDLLSNRRATKRSRRN
ncbi:Menin [Nymphon striatum]|nr:Menin [Nymphon striatum]